MGFRERGVVIIMLTHMRCGAMFYNPPSRYYSLFLTNVCSPATISYISRMCAVPLLLPTSHECVQSRTA